MHGTTPTPLPQLAGRVFLSEAGLETDLIFHHDLELPDFATYPLLESANGRRTLTDYFEAVIAVARRAGTGTVLETPTWRANPDWGRRLGYTPEELDRVNREAVRFFLGLRAANPDVPVVVSGNLGPRGDGYVVEAELSVEEAASYHRPQIRSLAAAGADLITAMTLTHSAEAAGIVTAAREVGIPVVISFTLETDGRLPSGQRLADAIDEVDRVTDRYAAYFMINCAHPDHFATVLAASGPWERLRGIRANASRMSHAELDQATGLDRGDEAELARSYRELAAILPGLAVVGGCCGTDLAHLESISDALPLATPRPTLDREIVPTAFHNGWRGRFNAWFFTFFDRYIAHIARRHKDATFGDLQPGTIVEIGAGVGANFDYIPAGSRVVAIEPNLAMHPGLRERAAERRIDLEVHTVSAQHMPLDTASVDDVLCSLVLCTVDDPDAVLAEIRRVLRPGGRLRFVEHVAAPRWSPRRWLQHALRAPWSWLFEGCDLCRDTPAAIDRAGFSRVQVERRGLRHSVFIPVNTTVHGIATR